MAVDDPYADLKVLLHWHAQPTQRRLSRRQVTIGPFCKDEQTADGVVSLQTPLGRFDIKSVVDRLPAHQRPDVFITVADSTKASLASNLAALDCPSVLVVGDTHHLEAPLRFMLGAVLAEPYGLVLGHGLPQHLHFLWHAVPNRLVSIPGIWVRHHDLPFREQRSHGAIFVGQVGRFHPYRGLALDAVGRANLPLEVVQLPEDQAARHYGDAVLALNVSLNGDISQRTFEVLGHGGCLLTDRLAPESGLERMFQPGEHLVCFDDLDDLAAKMRHYLQHPDQALAIARRGFEAYRRDHHPDIKRRQLFSALLRDGRYPAPAWVDPRAQTPDADEPQGLMARVLVYEHVQEQHRTVARLHALATPAVDARTLTDLADLSRLVLRRWRPAAAPPDRIEEILARLGYAARIGRSDGTQPVDTLLTTSAELADGSAARVIASARPGRVVRSGPAVADEARDDAALAACGYTRMVDAPAVYIRPA
jgi:hypothetical protein